MNAILNYVIMTVITALEIKICCEESIGIDLGNTISFEYWYWYWQYFFHAVLLLVLAITFSSIVNNPDLP